MMIFRIKHETKTVLFIAFAAMLLFFALMFISVYSLKLILVSLPFLAASLVCSLLCLIEQAVGTTLIVEDSELTIKHLWKRDTIFLSDINDVRIEPYKRHRRPARGVAYTEFRMRMTIDVGNSGEIVLNDKATGIKSAAGFLLGKRERIPDEDVPLFKAYQVIQSKLY